jgi:hypothetical protein
MTFALALAAIRSHPCSIALTMLLALASANVIGVSVATALAVWLILALIGFEVWYALEPTALQRLASSREPTAAERQRLESALGRSQLCLLVAETPDLVAVRGLRCVVVSRDLLDVFEDRALAGLLNQVVAPVRAANLAGFLLVWLGNLPLLLAWYAIGLLGQLGRLLAVLVGSSLLLPLLLFRDAFLYWTGRLFTVMLVGLIGWVLLVSGSHAALGFAILLAWAIVPTVRAILAWESRRAEWSADASAIADGFGLQLLEAVDFLALAEPLPAADSLLRLLCLPRPSSVKRAERIRRALRTPHFG